MKRLVTPTEVASATKVLGSGAGSRSGGRLTCSRSWGCCEPSIVFVEHESGVP